MALLYNNEEKLNYVFKKLKLQTQEIAKKLEISPALISQIQNHYNDKLKKIHLYAICSAYNIPMEIFENENINEEETIDILLEESQHHSMFHHDQELLEKLTGTWYLYSYPSNPKLSEVWSTETTIYKDSRVEDLHQNRGKLYIGEKQSVILKESHNSRNITSITFDNTRVTYGTFPFSRVSKSNSLNKELFNFGFFSKQKLSNEEAKEVLGSVHEVQLQMNYELLERISAQIKMKG